MPTILKITLEAAEYLEKLKKVEAETKAAAARMANAAPVPKATPAEEPGKSTSSVAGKTKQSAETAASAIKKATGDVASGLDTLEQKAEKTGKAIHSVSKSQGLKGIGEKVNKGATAISAIGSASGASVPAVGMLGAALNALTSPLSAITALLSALMAIGMAVWEHLTVSAEEFAESARHATEIAEKQMEKTKEQDQAAQEYVARLKELQSAENATLATQNETLQILTALQRGYGDLGVRIDKASGSISNLGEVEARLNAKRKKAIADQQYNVASAKMDQAKAAYMKAKGGEWLTIDYFAGAEFDKRRYKLSPEAFLASVEDDAGAADNAEDKQNYHDAATKLREALEAKKTAESYDDIGYASADEKAKAVSEAQGKANAASRAASDAWWAAENRKSDDAFADEKDIDRKRENRQARIAREREHREGIEGQRKLAIKDFAKVSDTGDDVAIAAARKQMSELDLQHQSSLDREAALERQIAELNKAQTEAKKRLADQGKFEVEYNALLLRGEYDKAAALKLEKELRDQNLKLTQREKDEILAQRKALGDVNLKQSQQNQLRDLQGKAMEQAGRGREAAEAKALEEARKLQPNLTDDQIANVRKIAALSWGLNNAERPDFGDTSVKTNSLTARGGFSTGAKGPDTGKIAEETKNYVKQQLETAQEIRRMLENLGA